MADAPIAPAAEPVAPIDAAEPVDRLAALSREELAAWRQTGNLPEPKASDDNDDEPATGDIPAAPAASAGAEPAPSSPLKPISKRQQQINDLERRAKAAEIERDDLRARVAQSAPSPAARPSAPLGAPAAPAGDVARDGAPPVFYTGPQPKLREFVEQIGTTYEDYEAALEAHALALNTWTHDERDAKSRITEAQTRADQIGRDAFAAYLARETAVKATTPDFDQRTAAVRQVIDIRTPLGAALIDSPVAPQLLIHFADHPEEFQRIGALGMTNLPAALRALGKLEALYDTGPSASAAPTAPKTVSSAPAPPTTLGSRPADPGDEAKAAVLRGDFRAFKEAEDRKAAARLKAGMR